MEIKLPKGNQAVNFFKFSFILAVVIGLLTWSLLKNDPLLEEAEYLISRNSQVTSKVGSVESINLVSATYVNSAIDYDGVATPGYNIYWFKIIGSSGEASAHIKLEKSKAEEVIVKEVSVYE